MSHKNKKSIYLATPYVNKDPFIMEQRYLNATKVAGILMSEPYNFVVYSPITHCHRIKQIHSLPNTWDFWSKVDFHFIDKLDEVWVYMQEGWGESVGVKAEILYALENHKNVQYFQYNGKEIYFK